MNTLDIKQYKWAGTWGPFTIKIPCGECSANEDIIKDVIEKDFAGQPISFQILPWLDNWWGVLLKGGWHAPVITINGKVIAQGKVIDRGLLGYEIRKKLVKLYQPEGNIVYTKPNCSFCKKTKELLREYNIDFVEKNIIEDPLAAHELFYLTKQFFPKTKPITVPQIWLSGSYFGDAETLAQTNKAEILKKYKP